MLVQREVTLIYHALSPSLLTQQNLWSLSDWSNKNTSLSKNETNALKLKLVQTSYDMCIFPQFSL